MRVVLYPCLPPGVEGKRHPYYVKPEPIPGKSGDDAWPVQIGDSPQIGSWQTWEMVIEGNNVFLDHPEAKRTLCWANSGRLETRPHKTRGSWETLRGQQEAEKNGNKKMVYRFNGAQLLGFIEFVEV